MFRKTRNTIEDLQGQVVNLQEMVDHLQSEVHVLNVENSQLNLDVLAHEAQLRADQAFAVALSNGDITLPFSDPRWINWGGSGAWDTEQRIAAVLSFIASASTGFETEPTLVTHAKSWLWNFHNVDYDAVLEDVERRASEAALDEHWSSLRRLVG